MLKKNFIILFIGNEISDIWFNVVIVMNKLWLEKLYDVFEEVYCVL